MEKGARVRGENRTLAFTTERRRSNERRETEADVEGEWPSLHSTRARWVVAPDEVL